MSKSTTIELGNYFDEFVARQVARGRYRSANEVLRAGLRLLEEEEARLEALRATLIEGEQSGFATPFDFDDFMKRKRRALEDSE